MPWWAFPDLYSMLITLAFLGQQRGFGGQQRGQGGWQQNTGSTQLFPQLGRMDSYPLDVFQNLFNALPRQPRLEREPLQSLYPPMTDKPRY